MIKKGSDSKVGSRSSSKDARDDEPEKEESADRKLCRELGIQFDEDWDSLSSGSYDSNDADIARKGGMDWIFSDKAQKLHDGSLLGSQSKDEGGDGKASYKNPPEVRSLIPKCPVKFVWDRNKEELTTLPPSFDEDGDELAWEHTFGAVKQINQHYGDLMEKYKDKVHAELAD